MTTTRSLTDITTPTAELAPGTKISTGTKTGTKIHAGSPGSSTTACGHWMKHNGERSRRYQPVNCERCIAALEGSTIR